MISKDILKKIRQVEIHTRRLVNESFIGEYHSVFKGRGMEFGEVREYQPGDEIRTIDWNVTARMGRPFIKRFVEERELTVMLLVDVSASGNFGSIKQLKNEIATEICALLAFSAIKNNDKVGMIMFTDKIEKFIPPKKGAKHVLRVIRELLCSVPSGKGTNISVALEYMNKIAARRTISFIVSDFKALNSFLARGFAVSTKSISPDSASFNSIKPTFGNSCSLGSTTVIAITSCFLFAMRNACT